MAMGGAMPADTDEERNVPPASAYVDPDRYEAERLAIFARQWTVSSRTCWLWPRMNRSAGTV